MTRGRGDYSETSYQIEEDLEDLDRMQYARANQYLGGGTAALVGNDALRCNLKLLDGARHAGRSMAGLVITSFSFQHAQYKL